MAPGIIATKVSKNLTCLSENKRERRSILIGSFSSSTTVFSTFLTASPVWRGVGGRAESQQRGGHQITI